MAAPPRVNDGAAIPHRPPPIPLQAWHNTNAMNASRNTSKMQPTPTTTATNTAWSSSTQTPGRPPRCVVPDTPLNRPPRLSVQAILPIHTQPTTTTTTTLPRASSFHVLGPSRVDAPPVLPPRVASTPPAARPRTAPLHRPWFSTTLAKTEEDEKWPTSTTGEFSRLLQNLRSMVKEGRQWSLDLSTPREEGWMAPPTTSSSSSSSTQHASWITATHTRTCNKNESPTAACNAPPPPSTSVVVDVAHRKLEPSPPPKPPAAVVCSAVIAPTSSNASKTTTTTATTTVLENDSPTSSNHDHGFDAINAPTPAPHVNAVPTSTLVEQQMAALRQTPRSRMRQHTPPKVHGHSPTKAPTPTRDVRASSDAAPTSAHATQTSIKAPFVNPFCVGRPTTSHGAGRRNSQPPLINAITQPCFTSPHVEAPSVAAPASETGADDHVPTAELSPARVRRREVHAVALDEDPTSILSVTTAEESSESSMGVIVGFRPSAFDEVGCQQRQRVANNVVFSLVIEEVPSEEELEEVEGWLEGEHPWTPAVVVRHRHHCEAPTHEVDEADISRVVRPTPRRPTPRRGGRLAVQPSGGSILCAPTHVSAPENMYVPEPNSFGTARRNRRHRHRRLPNEDDACFPEVAEVCPEEATPTAIVDVGAAMQVDWYIK